MMVRAWPYVATSTNDNATYHLVELDGTRITVLVTGKQIKPFKKRHGAELDLEIEDGSTDEGRGVR